MAPAPYDVPDPSPCAFPPAWSTDRKYGSPAKAKPAPTARPPAIYSSRFTSVPTLEKPVRVRIPAGTPDGRVLRVRGRGVPKRDGSFGDLYVKVKIQVPKDLTADVKDALRSYMEAEKHMGFDPRATWAGNE